MDFSIRPALASDRSAVLALAPRLRIGMTPLRDNDRMEAAVVQWLELSLGEDSDGVALVAVAKAENDNNGDQGEVIGFVSLSTTGHFIGETDAYVGELMVDERFAGQGVGRALVDSVEEAARERGHRCITLTTGAANDGALAFYNKLGYRAEDVTMTKVL